MKIEYRIEKVLNTFELKDKKWYSLKEELESDMPEELVLKKIIKDAKEKGLVETLNTNQIYDYSQN